MNNGKTKKLRTLFYLSRQRGSYKDVPRFYPWKFKKHYRFQQTSLEVPT